MTLHPRQITLHPRQMTLHPRQMELHPKQMELNLRRLKWHSGGSIQAGNTLKSFEVRKLRLQRIFGWRRELTKMPLLEPDSLGHTLVHKTKNEMYF